MELSSCWEEAEEDFDSIVIVDSCSALFLLFTFVVLLFFRRIDICLLSVLELWGRFWIFYWFYSFQTRLWVWLFNTKLERSISKPVCSFWKLYVVCQNNIMDDCFRGSVVFLKHNCLISGWEPYVGLMLLLLLSYFCFVLMF